MRTRRLVPIWSLLALFVCDAALAQEFDWNAPAAQPAQPAAPPAAAPASGDQAPKPPDPDSITDPAARALLATGPQTPAELARAAATMADLGQPLWAREYLRRLLAAKPDAATLAGLLDRFQSPMFLRMAANPELQPEGQQLAEAVLGASTAQLREAERLRGLTKQLQSPEPVARQEALFRLQQAGNSAVLSLLEVLRDPARTGEYPATRLALARLAAAAVGPLTAALDSGEPRFMVEVLRTLQAMKARDALPEIIYLAASPESGAEVRAAAQAALVSMLGVQARPAEAAQVLAGEAQLYYDRRRPVTERSGRVELWVWDSQKNAPVPRMVPADQAARRRAARLAQWAYALAPGDRAVELLHLGAMLEAAAYDNGLAQPLPEGPGSVVALAGEHGVRAIEDLLAGALRDNRPVVATAAAQVLGAVGRAEELVVDGPQPRPLVEATYAGDRRLRMAAIGAVMRLDPQMRFPGSSHIPMGLEFFAATNGSRRVLVASPIEETSRNLATIFRRLGYETDTARDGREALDLLHGTPDYELVMLDTGIDHPTSDLLIQQFRKHSRTADLRVILFAREGFYPRAEQVAGRDRLTLAAHRPHDEEALRWQIGRLMAIDPQSFVGFEERQAQAAQALAWWASLADRPDTIHGLAALEEFNLRKLQAALVNPLFVPELSERVMAVLGNLGTPQSQLALVELASRTTQPVEIRRAALGAFGRNVERNGVLLTTGAILRQYDRYNASETLDPATQHILGSLLNYIELPTVALHTPQEEAAEQAKPE